MIRRFLFLLLAVVAVGMAHAQEQRTVHVPVPGTLANYISASERDLITDLTVTGEINGKDFVLLRHMGGCSGISTYTDGQLRNLDLSGATIVASNDVYFSYANRSYTTTDNVLGAYIFLNADRLEHVALPGSLVEIGDQAFSGCEGLLDIEIPEGVTTLGVGAFLLCNSITTLTIPNSVTTMRTGSMQRMDNLREVFLGDGITELENSVFMYDNKLQTVHFGKALTSFDSVIFNTLPGFQAFDVSEENPDFKSVDGVLFNKEGWALLIYPPNKSDVTYNVSEDVAVIGGYSFQMAQNLKTINIPSTVEEIGEQAFVGAVRLTDVNMSEGLRVIGDYAFGAMESCRSITLPASVEEMGEAVFYMNLVLENINVAEGSSLLSSADGILYSKDGTRLIAFPGGRRVDSFTTGPDVTDIDDYAFVAMTYPQEVSLPNVKSIGDYAFYYSQELRTVSLGGQVEHIGVAAFMDSENLREVYCYPQVLTDVDPDAFLNEELIIRGKLYVPAGTHDFYLAQPWVTNEEYGVQAFRYIEEMEADGIQQVSAADVPAATQLFSVDGRRVGSSQRGIVILREGNKVRKVIAPHD